MGKLIERIKEWEDNTFNCGDNVEWKPFVLSFATILFISFIVIITSLALYSEKLMLHPRGSNVFNLCFYNG